MKQKISFDVKKEGNEIVFNQSLVKRLSLLEASTELNALQGQIFQLKKFGELTVKQTKENINKQLENSKRQVTEMEKALKDDKIIKKGIEKSMEDLDKLIPLADKLSKLIAPLLEGIKNDLKKKVRKAKAKIGYMRMTDTNQKIVVQNEILAPLCVEFNLDMSNPIIKEIKRDFDKI